MDLTEQSAASVPSSAPTQTFEVTPEDVVELAVMLRLAASRLEREADSARRDLFLKNPWMDDPVSTWIRDVFNRYFVEAHNSFANVVRDVYEQYVAQTRALFAAAERYGKTDELNAELLKHLR